MSNLFAFLRGFVDVKVIMWRERIAQHHHSEGGEWDLLPDDQPEKRVCHDVEFGWRAPYQWRENIIKKIILLHGMNIQWTNQTAVAVLPGAVFWLPIFERSLAWTSYHPSNMQKGSECTHFCHTPYLWLPIWEYMARALMSASSTKEKRRRIRKYSGIPNENPLTCAGEVYNQIYKATKEDLFFHQDPSQIDSENRQVMEQDLSAYGTQPQDPAEVP